MRKLYAFLFITLVLFVSAVNQASAQNYTFTTSAGNPIVPGTTLVPGSQGDDLTVSVALPFSYSAYGTVYPSVNVGTNGNLQFTTTNTAFVNACPLPAAGMGVSFLPHWDDLITTNAGFGIFTSTSGVAPNRIFNIEWRARIFGGTLPVNFEARLFEGQQRIDFIYESIDGNGNSASIGVQSLPTLQTTFSCNTTSLSSGLRVSFILVPPNDDCSGAIPINCGQTINSTTAGATVDAVAACGPTLNTAPGVWYNFVGDGTTVTLSLCGSAYDTKIGVFSGTCAALTCVAGNDDFCGLQSQVIFVSVPGINYNILVTGFGGASGTFSLTRSGVCLPPCAGVPSPGLITGPSGTLCGGTPVLLTVSGFSGATGLTFQWKSSATPGGPYTAIPGATAPTYAFSTTTTRYFIVTVTCATSGLSANTTEFAVNVNTLAHINVLATPSTVCAPGATVITGTATGGNLVGGTSVLGTSGTINLAIPDNTPAGVNTTITLPASSIPIAASLKVRINMAPPHTWVGDLIFRLTSPCGTTFLFDRPGVPPIFGNSADLGGVYTFDLGAATVIPESGGGVIPPGSYRPSDVNGAPHNWAGLTFPCTVTGNWTLNISDNGGGDNGTLADWQILGPGVGNYTHALTGPGTIVQNPPSGSNNANASFNVTGLPAGSQVMTLTSTDVSGCTFSTPVTVTVNPLPVFTIAPAAPVICAGAIQPLTANVTTPGQNYTFTTSAGNAIVPGTTLVPLSQADDATSLVALPFSYTAYGTSYPSVRVGTNGNLQFTTNNTAFTNTCPLPSATMGVAFHPHWDDLNMSAGGALGIYTSTTGVAPNRIFNIEWRALRFLGVNPVSFEARLFEGQQRVDFIYGACDLNGASASIGVQSFPTAQQTTFSCNTGSLSSGLGVSFTIPPPVPIPVTFSPLTELYTDAGATSAYTGTLVSTVYAKPSVTRIYTATATVLGCSNTANVTVTVNQLPAITTHPLPAAQTICPGFNVVYTVGATGAGLTYQWRKNGVNLVNAGFVSGVTTNTLTLSTVSVADNGTYDVVVSGTCAPPVTSNGAVLSIATAPTISTQPVPRIVCQNTDAVFSVVASGTPAPTIYQWQVRVGAVGPWVNLTTGGSYTSTFTITGAALSLSGNFYRVVVTNICGQTITSSEVLLTVNPIPVVVATDLWTRRICISDTLVPLVGTPVGGSWSGIGVSGFNFVPTATAVGTYTLTYTYTNSFGCTISDTTKVIVSDCPERIRLIRDNAIILYPNPNNGKFNIRINSTLYNFLGMKVFNTAGQLMNGTTINKVLTSPTYGGLVYGRVIPIDLSYLPSGVYLVKFYYDDGIRTGEKTFEVIIGGR